MKKINLFGALLSIIVILASCGPTAHLEKANNINLSSYRSFAWAQKDEKNARGNLAEEKIKDAISSGLEQTRGWSHVKRNPDVILSYDVLVEKGTRVESDPVYTWGGFRTFYNPYRRRFYNVYYPSRFIGYDNYRVPVKKGTIMITMVDSNTGKTILQSWATDELESSRLTSMEVNRIVKAIMEKVDKVG